MDEVEDWEYISCSLCYASNDFRVLGCGHAFCMGCLQILRKRHGRRIPCPRDRLIDRREISQLSEPHECQGEVIISSIDEERYKNLNQLIDAQIKDRMDTINVLDNFAQRFKWTVCGFSLLFWYGCIFGVSPFVIFKNTFAGCCNYPIYIYTHTHTHTHIYIYIFLSIISTFLFAPKKEKSWLLASY